MILEIGDIVVVKGTKFKNTNKYDTRIYGHPALVLDATEDMFYYLIIRSKPYGEIYIQNPKGKKGKKKYKLCNEDELKRYGVYESTLRYGRRLHMGYYDLGSIYKRNIDYNYIVHDTIESNRLVTVLNKLIIYQENYGEDEFYKEVKEKIERYIEQTKYELNEANKKGVKCYTR
jgi:hypothetical protein